MSDIENNELDQMSSETPDDFAAEVLDAATDAEPSADAKAQKKKKEPGKFRKNMSKPVVGKLKRGHVTLIVVIVVIAAAGLGFNAYHETPAFCGDICHASMDGYVPTFYATPGQSATDKWGNEVEDASGMLAAVHHAAGSESCMSCHHAQIVEQVTEGIETLIGDYNAPLSERNLTNLIHYWPSGTVYTEFCLNESCHDLTVSDLTEKTSYMARNPHSWHHWEYTCSDCHKAHRASVMICSQCHDDATIPDGWISAEEADNLTTRYGAYDDEA